MKINNALPRSYFFREQCPKSISMEKRVANPDKKGNNGYQDRKNYRVFNESEP